MRATSHIRKKSIVLQLGKYIFNETKRTIYDKIKKSKCVQTLSSSSSASILVVESGAVPDVIMVGGIEVFAFFFFSSAVSTLSEYIHNLLGAAGAASVTFVVGDVVFTSADAAATGSPVGAVAVITGLDIPCLMTTPRSRFGRETSSPERN